MPERIPAPPPLRPLTASLSPLVWYVPPRPFRFVLRGPGTPVCVPQLRGRKVMDFAGHSVDSSRNNYA